VRESKASLILCIISLIARPREVTRIIRQWFSDGRGPWAAFWVMEEADTQIQEGFMCPMCMVNLESSEDLLAHFDQKHGANADSAVSL
jgi:hypothetical protein